MVNTDPATISPGFTDELRVFHDANTHRGFPFGGLSGGGLTMHVDGDFNLVYTAYNWCQPVSHPKGSFFAVRTRDHRGRVQARLLRRNHHGGEDFSVDHVPHADFTSHFPEFLMNFEDTGLPVRVSLSGFSPLIPHNPVDSTLPVVIFELTAHNPNEDAIEFSALFSWQNTLGATGTGGGLALHRHRFSSQAERHRYAIPPEDGLTGVKFALARDYHRGDSRRRAVGHQMITVENRPGWTVSPLYSWDQRQERPIFWNVFRDAGVAYDVDVRDRQRRPEALKGKCGALTVSTMLPAGDTVTIPFYLFWFHPYYVIQKEARWKMAAGVYDGVDHGVYAAGRFDRIEDLARYVMRERTRLHSESRELERVITREGVSPMPGWLVETVLNCSGALAGNAVLTRESGFHVIAETGRPCRDTWRDRLFHPGALVGALDRMLASHVFGMAFHPALSRAELQTFIAMTRDGVVPHATGGAEIALADPETPRCPGARGLRRRLRPDLGCALILQIGHLVRLTGDLELLDHAWPVMMRIADRLHAAAPEGIPEETGKPVCGLGVGTLYAASCRMMAALAPHVAPEVDAEAEEHGREYARRAEIAAFLFQSRLWLPESGYFQACYGDDRLTLDGLAGDWVSRLAGLTPSIPVDRARSHCLKQLRVLAPEAIYDAAIWPLPRAHPSDSQPSRQAAIQAQCHAPHVGPAVSYLALEAIQLGWVREGFDLLRGLADRAALRDPWAMGGTGENTFPQRDQTAFWGVFQALTGAALDLPGGRLMITPQRPPTGSRMRWPVFFPWFWLAVEYDPAEGKGSLAVTRVFDGHRNLVRKPAGLTGSRITLNSLALPREDGSTQIMDLGEAVIEPGLAIPFSLDAAR